MSDLAETTSPPTIDTPPVNQSARNPIVETYPEHVPQFSVIHELPAVKRMHPAQEKHLWNPETARLAGLKSAQARRGRKLNPPKPTTNQSEPLPAVNPRLELVREQIQLTRATLNDTRTDYCPACERAGMEPHHRAALLRALDSLLDRERIMLGIPGPGTLKPASQSRRRSDPSPEPTPTPQEPQS